MIKIDSELTFLFTSFLALNIALHHAMGKKKQKRSQLRRERIASLASLASLAVPHFECESCFQR